jgi:hypothetical protein
VVVVVGGGAKGKGLDEEVDVDVETQGVKKGKKKSSKKASDKKSGEQKVQRGARAKSNVSVLSAVAWWWVLGGGEGVVWGC